MIDIPQRTTGTHNRTSTWYSQSSVSLLLKETFVCANIGPVIAVGTAAGTRQVNEAVLLDQEKALSKLKLDQQRLTPPPVEESALRCTRPWHGA